MSHEHGHPARELPLLALAHVIDLVRHMFDVELRKPPFAQQSRLLLCPEDHILVISRQPFSGSLWLSRPHCADLKKLRAFSRW